MTLGFTSKTTSQRIPVIEIVSDIQDQGRMNMIDLFWHNWHHHTNIFCFTDGEELKS